MPLRVCMGSNLGKRGGHRSNKGSFFEKLLLHRHTPLTFPFSFSHFQLLVAVLVVSQLLHCVFVCVIFIVVISFILAQALSAESSFGQNSAAQPCLPSLLIVLAWHFVLVLLCTRAQLILCSGWFCHEPAPSQHSATAL